MLDLPGSLVSHITDPFRLQVEVGHCWPESEVVEGGNTGPGEGLALVRLEYRTQPGSRSLHWRQDCAGQPCLYTAAGAINNRGLLPCQVSWGSNRNLDSDIVGRANSIRQLDWSGLGAGRGAGGLHHG